MALGTCLGCFGMDLSSSPLVTTQTRYRINQFAALGLLAKLYLNAEVYTGTAIKGIGTMHKSNAVPIFSNEEAQDIAKMRR